MNDDTHLLRRYAEEGSEADFTALVLRHFDLVYSAALRQLPGDQHRARDIAQLVFIDVAAKAGKLSRHPSFIGWLYTSTHFAAQKMKRAEIRRLAREAAAGAEDGLGPGTAAGSWEGLRPYLDAEMLALGGTDRTAILLRFFEQRPFAEIGSQLGLSENAARMRVDRALAKLRHRLAKRGIASTTAILGASLTANAVTAAPAGLSALVAGSALTETAALYGAGTAGGVTIAAHLMASKFTIGVVAACGLLALGSGAYYSEQRRESAQSIVRLHRETDQLEAALRALPSSSRTMPVSAGKPQPVRPVQGTGATGAKSQALADFLNREIAENPQLRRALGRSFTAEFRLKYTPLAKTLGWSETQLSQLAVADLKMRSDLFDLDQAARLSGDDLSADPSLDALKQRVVNAHADTVSTLIGADGWQRWQDYDRSYAAQDIANQVAGGTFYGAAPLTASQAAALTQVLANNSPAFQQGGAIDPTTLDWDRALAQATAVLPSAQVEALRSVRAQLEQQRLASMAEAGEGGTP
jgi:RNA polymerase sigma factor (sigma-70 family)